MSAVEIIQIILVAMVFPFVAYFFKKNETMHERTQNSLHIQDLRVATMELQIAVLYNHLNLPMPTGVHNGT